MAFSRSFDFDQGSLGRNLTTFDEHVHEFIKRDVDVHTAQGEAAMKVNAPWTDRTGHARETLWADNHTSDDSYSISMGHGAEYGVYLEESNNGKFQIVMPTLLATARSLMRSLEHMFAQMETHTPITPVITPGVGTRPGTSQGVRERTVGAKTRPSVNVRNERGRFVDQGKGYSKAAKAAKAAARLAVKSVKSATKRTRQTRRG